MGDERATIADRRVAQAEREEFKQSHAASLLQWILLFASHVAGTGTGIGGEDVTGIRFDNSLIFSGLTMLLSI